MWGWVQESGQRAMMQLNVQLAALVQGVLPDEEALAGAIKVLPLLMG